MHELSGPRAPAIVNTVEWLLDPAAYMDRLQRRFGDMFTLRTVVFGTEVVVSRPEALKQVLNGNPEVFLAGEGNALLAPFLGDRSILMLDGPLHLRLRRLMLPASHGERMLQYTETMREVAARAASTLPRGRSCSMHETFQQITLDVILGALLGLRGAEIERVGGPITRFLNRVQSRAGSLFMIPALQRDLGPLTPWASLKRDIDRMRAAVLDHVRARRAEAGGAQRGDLLETLLMGRDDAGEGFDHEDLRDQMLTLIAAGHETTATSMCWFLEDVLRCPGEQDRLRAEIRSVTEGGPLLPEHMGRLVRLESAIKESLRLHPPTGTVVRRLKRAETIQGVEIPAGTLVAACMYMTHRLHDLYPDPHRFDPERFIGKKIDPYEWLPFGGGVRRCLGMAFALHEMKVVLATLLDALEIELVARGPAKTGLRSYICAPRGGTRVVLRDAIPSGPRTRSPADRAGRGPGQDVQRPARSTQDPPWASQD